MTTGLTRMLKRLTGKSWKCFHCSEEFFNENDALDHFGETQCAEPLCFEAKSKKERELLTMVMRMERESEAKSEKIEALEYMNSGHAEIFKAFGKNITTFDQAYRDFSELKYRAKVQQQVIDECRVRFGDREVAKLLADCAGEQHNAHLYTSL